ncbi:MAG TPA: hypothetical protein DEF34_11320 [Desulfotomaculum sp.]|nr:hypothetical protein [Desulfotomaculum sp.]
MLEAGCKLIVTATKDLYTRLWQTIKSGMPAIMYTLVNQPGLTGLKGGSRLLILADGSTLGTLGLPQLDKQAADRAGDLILKGRPGTKIIPLQAANHNRTANAVSVLEDCYFSNKKLVVFGAGHVALPLVEMAAILGFKTVVVDDRPEFCNSERFPGADALICNRDYSLSGEEIDRNTSIVIITRGHKHDQACLKEAIKSAASYIGMIGSSSKVRQTFKELLHQGASKQQLEKVAAPIGLDLGGQQPAEIALSILAEIVSMDNNGSGKPLKTVKTVVLE